MLAAVLTEFGAPGVLRATEVPAPHAGPGEIRIRVSAASVTPADLLFRQGGLAARLPDPAGGLVPGTEVAGIIDEAPVDGPWSLGAAVMAIVVPWRQCRGGYAEHVVVPAASAATAPVNCSLASAAAVPMSGLTALAMLDRLGLAPGMTLAVAGAAGVVGGFVVQLAKQAGLTVIADSSPVTQSRVSALGADFVLPRGLDYPRRIRELLPPGVDIMVDTALMGEPLLEAVIDGGKLVSLRARALPVVRGIDCSGVLVWEHAEDQARLQRLSTLIDAGVVNAPMVDQVDMADAASAHARLEAASQPNRIVLRA